MRRGLFRPSTAQICWPAAVGIGAVCVALYVRYRIIEESSVGLACEAGLRTWQCEVRRGAMLLFNNSVFGYVALVAAALNLMRPSIVLFLLSLLAGGTGVVLYNTALSALALALLILSLARPEPEPE